MFFKSFAFTFLHIVYIDEITVLSHNTQEGQDLSTAAKKVASELSQNRFGTDSPCLHFAVDAFDDDLNIVPKTIRRAKKRSKQDDETEDALKEMNYEALAKNATEKVQKALKISKAKEEKENEGTIWSTFYETGRVHFETKRPRRSLIDESELSDLSIGRMQRFVDEFFKMLSDYENVLVALPWIVAELRHELKRHPLHPINFRQRVSSYCNTHFTVQQILNEFDILKKNMPFFENTSPVSFARDKMAFATQFADEFVTKILNNDI